MLELMGKSYICKPFGKSVLCRVGAETPDFQEGKKFLEKKSRFLLVIQINSAYLCIRFSKAVFLSQDIL